MNWFDFETKMRKLIYEIIEPINQKVDEHKDKISKMKNESDYYKKRFENFNYELNKIDHKASMVDDTMSKIMKMVNQVQHYYIQENLI